MQVLQKCEGPSKGCDYHADTCWKCLLQAEPLGTNPTGGHADCIYIAIQLVQFRAKFSLLAQIISI